MDNNNLPISAGINAAGQIGAAAIGAGVSIASNRNAKYLARLQNEWNYKMFNEQNAWNLEQWHRTNQYNSPIEARKRLEAAGYNPYLMFSNAGMGSASSLQSANAQPAAPINYTDPGPSITSALSQAVNNISNQIYNNNLIKSEVNKNNSTSENLNQQTNNLFEDWKFLRWINPIRREREKYESKIAELTFGLMDQSFNDRLREIKLNNYSTYHQVQLIKAQERLASLSADQQEIVNKYLEPMQIQTLANIFAQGELMGAQAYQCYAAATDYLQSANLKKQEYDRIDSILQDWVKADKARLTNDYYKWSGKFDSTNPNFKHTPAYQERIFNHYNINKTKYDGFNSGRRFFTPDTKSFNFKLGDFSIGGDYSDPTTLIPTLFPLIDEYYK